jgi:putative ABC transport system permease protein
MVLRQGLNMALVGVVIGLALAASLTRVMGSLLFEVSGRDPITFIAVAVVVSGVCTLAIYLPARRAAGITPLQALRDEG